VKVLGTGDLGSVKLNVTADKFSGSAVTKIEAAGGSATTI
jgi:large subunit ribosomal protein L15